MKMTENGNLLDDYGNDLDAYVWGESADGTRALVVREIRDEQVAVVCTIHGNDLFGGRWECSARHLVDFDDLYRSRFPVQR